jgi:hypothetical protein
MLNFRSDGGPGLLFGLNTVASCLQSNSQDLSIGRCGIRVNTSSKRSIRYTSEEMFEIGRQLLFKDPKAVHKALMLDIGSSIKKDINPLNGPILMETKSVTQGEKSDLEAEINDADIDALTEVDWRDVHLPEDYDKQSTPDLRGQIAPETFGLQDWDGKWAPAPACWEFERDGFSKEFIPTYVNIWNLQNGSFKGVDMSDPKFILHGNPINTYTGQLVESIDHGLDFPSKLFLFFVS